MSHSHFLSSEIDQGEFNKAKFHIIPVPYEASVSYGSGTALGPDAIIRASDQLETFDQISGAPCMQGIHTHKSINCDAAPEVVMQSIRAATKSVAELGNIPIVLGGEHTVSYGAVMGVVDAYADEEIGIVHFDAHADLRDSYEGSIWSHASVMKRLVDEGLPLFQLGVRAISQEERDIRSQHASQIQYLDAIKICRPQLQHHFELPENFPKKIYISVDIDGLDSTIMPATGTPVPGGLGYWQLIDLIACATVNRTVVGMDLVEFAPIENLHAYNYTAADIVYKMMALSQIKNGF